MLNTWKHTPLGRPTLFWMKMMNEVRLDKPRAQTPPSHPDLVIDSWSTQKQYLGKFFICTLVPSLWPKPDIGYFWPISAHHFVWFLCQSKALKLTRKILSKWKPKSASVSQKVPKCFHTKNFEMLRIPCWSQWCRNGDPKVPQFSKKCPKSFQTKNIQTLRNLCWS